MGKVIVVALSDKEVEVILHALVSGHDVIVRTGGDQYGPMTLNDLSMLISRFQSYQRGD